MRSRISVLKDCERLSEAGDMSKKSGPQELDNFFTDIIIHAHDRPTNFENCW